MTGVDIANLAVQATMALATLAAVVVALTTATRESRARERAEARAEAAEEARARERDASDAARAARAAVSVARQHRAQAEAVIGWAEFDYTSSGAEMDSRTHWTILVVNHSEAPVFDVSVKVFHGQMRTWNEDLAVLPPRGSKTLSIDVSDEQAAIRVTVEFRDLAGTNWRRYQTGELLELNDQRQPV